MVRMNWDSRLSQGSSPAANSVGVKLEGGPAASMKPGQKSSVRSSGIITCRHEGLVKVRDEARLRRGHRNDQSHRGHQCSETTLTGESRFHVSTPRGFESGSLVTGSKRPQDQWDMVRMKWDCRPSTLTYSLTFVIKKTLFTYMHAYRPACWSVNKLKMHDLGGGEVNRLYEDCWFFKVKQRQKIYCHSPMKVAILWDFPPGFYHEKNFTPRLLNNKLTW
jgi:hypothetical protein